MSINCPTSSRPTVAQEWSLHAELTISHQGPATTQAARQIDSDGGMHMRYSWNNPVENSMTRNVPRPCYGFQRGNILFTTSPPTRNTQPNQTTTVTEQPRGCQTSANPVRGQVSSVSYSGATASKAPQPYNRRCKSTCSIVLSGEHSTNSSTPQDVNGTGTTGRGTSCSPVPRCYHTLTYRCGDPVCYHATSTAENVRPACSEFSSPPPVIKPLTENCEVCGGGRSPTAARRAARANTFTTHFCTRVPERNSVSDVGEKKIESVSKESKDAASQTSDLGNDDNGNKMSPTHGEQLEPECVLLHNTVPQQAIVTKKKHGKKLLQLSGTSPLAKKQSPVEDSRMSSPDVEVSSRKPRTVHIDVYCTGSEEADASDSVDTESESAEGESWSSPQTVFESDKLRVVHTRANKNQLPQALQQRQSNQRKQNFSQKSGSFTYEGPKVARDCQIHKGFDSDDGLSSQYPSKESSYTTIQDTELSYHTDTVGASRDPSWSTISSSVLFSDAYDSATATSWKDTTTEFDSLAESSVSLAQSDSFEYADAMDRLRIREKERAWAGKRSEGSAEHKSSHSPQTDRKHVLQQKKFKEFMEKHMGTLAFPLRKPKPAEDSDDDDEDETGDAWSFGCGVSSQKMGTIKREGTVRKANQGSQTASLDYSFNIPAGESTYARAIKADTPHIPCDSGSLSDSGPTTRRKFTRRVIGPFGSKSPSPPPAKLESTVTLPFTSAFGKTNQLSKAQKFGTIVGAFRKPGHHIGPSKNPDCTCVHCREYYGSRSYRGRARSVGDVPLERRAGRQYL